MRARVFVLVAALAVLLLPAVPALAVPDGPPVRFWDLSKIDRSAGVTTLTAAGSTGRFVVRFLDKTFACCSGVLGRRIPMSRFSQRGCSV